MSANPSNLCASPVAAAPDAASSAVPERLIGESPVRDELQSLLAFSAMHGQVRRSLAKTVSIAESPNFSPEQEKSFALEEVLQLITERALRVTEADGVAIALADDSGMTVRAQAGTIRPDIGQPIDMEALFSSTCFRTGQLLVCDDSEADERVNRSACDRLGARSLLAVPIRSRRGVLGILEAFSKNASGFDNADARHLTLLVELVTEAFTASDEERLSKCAQAVAERLQPAPPLPKKPVVNSMLRTSLSEPRMSSEAMEQPTLAHLSPAWDTGSTSPGEQSGLPGKPYAETIIAIAPDSEPQESRRPSTLFLTWFVVIAGAFVVGFGWRIGTSPKLSAGGLRAHTVQSASITPANQLSTVPAQPASGVDATAARKIDSMAKPPIQESARFSRVTGIQYVSNADSTTVTIVCDPPARYNAHRLTGPERIFFDLGDTRLDADLAKQPIQVGDAILKRIRAAQTEAGITRVVLETTGKADYSVTTATNPSGLKIEVRKKIQEQP